MNNDLLQPHYADKFRCIGPECEESCCQGWGTYVDKGTYKKYRATPSLRRAAAEHIEVDPQARNNFRYARIKFKADGCCPFLADDNLCNIQKQHGAAFLGKTCSRYPRALVRFDGRMQKALYLSCPEAARLVLLSPQLLPPPERARYDEFQLRPEQNSAPSSGALIRQIRGFALELLQDCNYPLWQRLFLLGTVCRRVDELHAGEATSRVSQLLAQYATMLREGSLHSHLDTIPARPSLQLGLVLQLIEKRFAIEQPHAGFVSCVADLLRAVGYAPEKSLPEMATRYHEAGTRYYEPFSRAFPSCMENYLLNYVFRTRFPFADLPDQVQDSAAPATSFLLLALHYRFLDSLLIGAAARHGSGFSTAHAVRVVHEFARAVEHNFKFFDELMKFVNSPELKQSDGLAVLLR